MSNMPFAPEFQSLIVYAYQVYGYHRPARPPCPPRPPRPPPAAETVGLLSCLRHDRIDPLILTSSRSPMLPVLSAPAVPEVVFGLTS